MHAYSHASQASPKSSCCACSHLLMAADAAASPLAAGTGGAGPTIMETTLLLAGEDVAAYK